MGPMASQTLELKRSVPFTGEYLRRYEINVRARLALIEEWRAAEQDAGRPSGLTDYCRAHELCPDCHGVGIARNDNGIGFKSAGWSGSTQVYEECIACWGSGRLTETL